MTFGNLELLDKIGKVKEISVFELIHKGKRCYKVA